MMRTIDLTNWSDDTFTKLRFKAYLNGGGSVADYLRALVDNDPMKRRSPKKQYCFQCHSDHIFVPSTIQDDFVVTIESTKHLVKVTDFPGDRCSQCGTFYQSVSLGAALEEILTNLIIQKLAEGNTIPEEFSLFEQIYDSKRIDDIDGDLIIFKKSELAKLVLSYGKRMDVAESKNDQISILAKMELLHQLIHSEGSDLND